MKRTIKILLATLGLMCLIIAINYFSLQRHMNNVLNDDSRNKDIKVWVHYKWFINPTEIKYDLRGISGENSALDVNRVMLQFSEEIKDKEFKKVYLSYKGKDKFYFKGDFFKNLGQEYGKQNPIYTLRTIPENVYMLNGEHAYSTWEGGWLGVMSRQMDDLKAYTKYWYLSDMIKEDDNL